MGILDLFTSLQASRNHTGDIEEASWDMPGPGPDGYLASLPSNMKDARFVDDAPMPELEALPRWNFWNQDDISTVQAYTDSELEILRAQIPLRTEWCYEYAATAMLAILSLFLPRPTDAVALRFTYAVSIFVASGHYYATFWFVVLAGSGKPGMQRMDKFMTGMRSSRFLTALARLPFFILVLSSVGCVVQVVVIILLHDSLAV